MSFRVRDVFRMGKPKKKSCNTAVLQSRKELRKKKRLKIKQRRQNFFSGIKFEYEKLAKNYNQKNANNAQDVSANVEDDSEIDSDFELSDDELNVKLNKIETIKAVRTDRLIQKQLKEKKQEKELKRKMKTYRIEQLKNANLEDDKMIRKLEKRLRIDKHKNDKSVHKMFNDGLDYALELCLPENIEKMYKTAKDAVETEESDDGLCADLANPLGKNETNTKKGYKNAEAECLKNNTHLNGIDSELESVADDIEKKSVNSEGENVDSNCGESTTNRAESGNYRINATVEHTWEDIYGRERNAVGEIIKLQTSKYIPPHAKVRLETDNLNDIKTKEKLDTLRRHCKGLLNRLSEANINKIASDVEHLYGKNSRFDINCILSKIINETIITNVLAPERMVLEYAMLVAVLHVNVGSEVGAHFLENLIIKIDKYVQNIPSLEVENKELDNTLYLLSHMYTFKIFQHSLIYDILNRLSEQLCEKSVECLLLVLRSIGFQLRRDNPAALKNLILNIQKKAYTAPSQIKENARLKFMLEVLLAIKNNNITKVPQYDPSLSEHLKKIFKSFMMNGKYVTTLSITIEDILSADQKGKWWVVGSAWSGNIRDIKATKKLEKQDTEKFSSQLLMLARQQGMNTEERKNVFCLIMSADDYVNAFEKLLHLCIKDQRVIVSVIIRCCLSEKTFNPYYGALAEKFCKYDRKYQLATQYTLWDRMKKIHSASKQERINLAQLIIYMINKGGQPVSMLKAIEFGEMDKVTLRFCRQIMLGILLGSEEDCYKVFARIRHSTKLDHFKYSLLLFIHHFLLKSSCNNVSPEQMELMKIRINIADELLQTRDSNVKF